MWKNFWVVNLPWNDPYILCRLSYGLCPISWSVHMSYILFRVPCFMVTCPVLYYMCHILCLISCPTCPMIYTIPQMNCLMVHDLFCVYTTTTYYVRPILYTLSYVRSQVPYSIFLPHMPYHKPHSLHALSYDICSVTCPSVPWAMCDSLCPVSCPSGPAIVCPFALALSCGLCSIWWSIHMSYVPSHVSVLWYS